MRLIEQMASTAPNMAWLAFMKMGFGYLLLIILGGLAGFISYHKIEASTSFGLDIILGGLLTLSGGFVGWAFREKDPKDPLPPA